MVLFAICTQIDLSFLGRDSLQKAEAWFAKGCPVKRDNPFAQYNAAVAALNQGKLKRAERCARQAIRISPRTSANFLVLAEIKKRQGDSTAVSKNLALAEKYAFTQLDRDRLEAFGQ